MRCHTISAVLICATIAGTGCEPDSVTAARDQIGRRAEGDLQLILPITDTTYFVSELLAGDLDTTTTPDGLLGIVQTQSVQSAVGEELAFNGVALDQFAFSYNQMLQTTEVTTSVAFANQRSAGAAFFVPGSPRDTIRFETPDGSDVASATVASGWIVRTTVNNTGCNATASLALLDDTGGTVVTLPDLVISMGQTIVDSVSAAGATMSGFIDANASATFGACVPAPGDSVSTSLTFRPLQLASVTLQNVQESFSQMYDVLASEPRVQAVDTVVVETGTLGLIVSNRLPVQLTVELVLNGFLDSNGDVLVDTVVVAPAAGDGSYAFGGTTIDLAGVTLVTEDAQATATGLAEAAQATFSLAVTTNAVIVDGAANILASSFAGDLDPALTPELVVDIEEFQELDSEQYDFDDLEDAIQSSTLNNGFIDLVITNTADLPIILSNLTLGAVPLDASGQPLRDGGGNLVYETDGSGTPLLVVVANPGETTLSLARQATTSISLDATPLVDRIVHRLIDDQRLAIVAVGTALAGDGSQGRFTRQDEVQVDLEVIVGLDFTIPVGGVTFTRNQTADGLDLSESDANDLASRVVSASLVAAVVNTTPFGVTIDIALAPDSLDSSVDVFSEPNAIVLDPIALSAPPVGANGVPTGSATDSVVISLSGNQTRVLFGETYTAGIRIRLAPRPDGGRRGAIRPSDGVAVDASADIRVRRGSS